MNANPDYKTDYEHTMRYFLHLADVRFKLLGFLPAITGTAALALSSANSVSNDPELGLALSVLGLAVAVGATIYDQRNTMIYDSLVRRAKFLEKKLGFPSRTGEGPGGPAHDRPERWPIPIFDPIWHDLALAIVYSSSLAVWTFLVARFAAQLGHVTPESVLDLAGRVLVTSILVLLLLALRNDFAHVTGRKLAQRLRQLLRSPRLLRREGPNDA